MWPLIAALMLASATSDEFADHLQRGIDETRQGAFANAMVDLQAAKGLKPDSPQVYFRMGLLFGQMADFSSAEAAFRAAVKLYPCFAEAHYNLGLTQVANPQNKLDWPAAIASFRDALKCRPDYAEASNYLGVGLMATGEVDAAIPGFETATRLNPGLAEAHFNLALALEKKERKTEAEAQYRLAIGARHGSYPEASTALGKLLFHSGNVNAGSRSCSPRCTPIPT